MTSLTERKSRPPSGRSAVSHVFRHDPCVKAAVIAAPPGVVFSSEGLRGVFVLAQLWRAEHDERATYHNIGTEHLLRASHKNL